MQLPRSILFSMLILFACNAMGQQVIFKTYTISDGMVANPVRCIYQDSQGFIWIGTYEGLSRYDGYKFRNFTTANGLSHSLINAIYESNGKILVAENDGSLDIIENGSVNKSFKTQSALNTIIVHRGRIFLTTDQNGIHEYKNDSLFVPPQDSSLKKLGDMLPLGNSLFMSNTSDFKMLLFNDKFSLYSISKKLEADHLYSLARDGQNRLFACTANGLKHLTLAGDSNTVAVNQIPPEFDFRPLNNAHVTCMMPEDDGSVWVGTWKGLIRVFPNGHYRVYDQKDGLPSTIIHSMYRDKEKNLWIGSALGLCKWVAKNNLVLYSAADKDFRNDAYGITQVENNDVLLYTEHGFQQYSPANKSFTDLNITSPNRWPVSRSDFWIQTNAGRVSVVDKKGKLIIPPLKPDKSINGVLNAPITCNNKFFLGTFTGLYALDKTGIQNILPWRITALICATDGSIWAGTWDHGLYRISTSPGADNVYVPENLNAYIGATEIRGLYEDGEKNMWVGTRYNGAFRLSKTTGNKFSAIQYSTKNGLMSDWVQTFAETKKGNVWIGSYLGLDKLIRNKKGYSVFNFSKAANFFADIKQLVTTSDNELLCIANKGIAVLQDDDLHLTPPLKATLLFAQLGLPGKSISINSPREKVHLKPTQNAARFEFSALGFMNEKQVMYSYRLKGSNDTSWSKPENVHEASYASLPPGDYVFEARTLGWNGEFGAPASFAFSIATPFWKQWWFIGLCFLLVAGAVYSLYRYRIKQLMQVQKMRNSIATDLHDDIGSSLTNISILAELSHKNILQPAEAEKFLRRIKEEVQYSGQAMDDIIWSVNSQNDTVEETLARMRRYTAELLEGSGIVYHLKFDEHIQHKKMNMEQRRDVFLMYKEMLNNIYKHAAARQVWINVSLQHNELGLEVTDDGKGFLSDIQSHRNGLKNLYQRSSKWNGSIRINSEEQKGTTININIPLVE